MAYWDMYAKMNRKRIYEINELLWEYIPLTDYTIGIDTTETMIEKVKEKSWPIYIIKLAGKQVIDIIKTLRQYTDAV